MNSTKYWIALERVSGMGPAHLKEIYSVISGAGVSLSDIFELTEDEIKNEFKFTPKILSSIKTAVEILPAVSDEYQKIIDFGINVTPFYSSAYPERLHRILGSSIPPILYSYGNLKILSKKGAAILGDTNISSRGEFISYMAAKELVSHKISVISGFAQGADITAHRSALEYGGDTIAMLPCGILKLNIPDMIKPVYDEERFLAVSGFYPEAAADKFSAFTRNKTICALAHAVFIVESPESGGIFEAAKSAHSLKVPLYTAEYSDYPPSALGNKKILAELEAFPVRGKKTSDNLTVPNMDRIIADVKFK
jgi:DNA processing protein